jgi:hypothetical protein
VATTAIFTTFSLYYLRKEIKSIINFLTKRQLPINNSSKLILFLISAVFLVSIPGALGPEIGFDALWYHLTLPKIFLSQSAVVHLPGGLFYYSDMPKLGEMIYQSLLSVGLGDLTKLIHFMFGILSTVALFKLSRRFFNVNHSLLVVLIFVSNLVFCWELTSAYIDLFRTFFEIMALWGLVIWYQEKNKKWLLESAVMLGLAISTKLLALGSLVTFCALIFYFGSDVIRDNNKRVKEIAKFAGLALFVTLPWFVFSTLNTGNPIFPIFSSYYQNPLLIDLINPLNVIKSFLTLFLHSSDPISPLYLILTPLAIIGYKKMSKEMKLISAYSVLALFLWYISPQTNGRFILPYLPAFSILAVYLIFQFKNLEKFLVGLALIIAISSIGYRALANVKYIPVVIGSESKAQFLSKNLNFSFGDFYDTDGYFKANIKPTDKVLLYGFHNLYYVDFPFIDSSYVKPGDKFNYVAVQSGKLPARYSFWHMIYQNPTTHVKLYSLGGGDWYY